MLPRFEVVQILAGDNWQGGERERGREREWTVDEDGTLIGSVDWFNSENEPPDRITVRFDGLFLPAALQ